MDNCSFPTIDIYEEEVDLYFLVEVFITYDNGIFLILTGCPNCVQIRHMSDVESMARLGVSSSIPVSFAYALHFVRRGMRIPMYPLC